MPTSTLVFTPKAGHVPPPLEQKDQQKVDLVYTRYGVAGGQPVEKIQALQKEIQARSFFAVGGEETELMELRANERIYLLCNV